MHRDTERLDWLEAMLKQSPRLFMHVCIETLPTEASVAACNEHHGASAGRVTGRTLREAVDLAMAKEFAEVLTK